MSVARKILELIRETRLGAGAAGAAVGGGLGGLLNEQDPEMGALGGAGMGALVGMLGARKRLPPQIYDETSPLASQLPRWKAGVVNAPGEMGWQDKGHSSLIDQYSPTYFGNYEAEMVGSNLTQGGIGEALSQENLIANELKEAAEKGLLDQVETYLGISTIPRQWDTLERKRQEAWNAAATARGLGNMSTYQQQKGIYDDLTRKISTRQVSTYGMSADDADSALRAMQETLGPEQFQEVERVGKKFQEALWNITKARKGEFDPEQFAIWEDQQNRGISYFPSFRDFHGEQLTPEGQLVRSLTEKTGFAKKRGISVTDFNDLINPLEGSTRPLDSPLESGFLYLQESIRQSKRNKEAKHFVNTAFSIAPQRSNGQPFIREILDDSQLAGGEGAVSFIEGGKVRRFAVPVEYADLLKIADAQSVSEGLRVMSKIQRWNAALITGKNIAFTAANVPRDIQRAWILLRMNPSDFGKFMNFWVTSFKQSFSGQYDELAHEAFAEGALGGTITRQLQMDAPWRKMLGREESGILGNAVGKVQTFTNAAEEATKLASYRLMKERGTDPVEAAFLTRRYAGSPDFGRFGTATASIRPWVQFWNPQIQGIVGNIERAKRDPIYMATWMGALSAGYVGVESYNRRFVDPETGRPYIEDVPLWERLSNIVIVDPTTSEDPVTYSNGVTRPVMLKIPLDHTARLLLSPIISAYQNMMGDPAAPSMAQATSNLLSQFLPTGEAIDVEDPFRSAGLQLLSSINPAVRIPVEQFADKEAFSGIPIEGSRLRGLEPTLRYTENTSPTARTIGETLGVSPARTEHVIKNLFPGIGESALRALDLSGRVEKPLPEMLTSVPGLGDLLRRIVVGSGSANRQRMSEDLYSLAEDASTATRSLNELANRGDSEGVDEYLDQNLNLIESNKGAQQIVRQLSQLNRWREEVLRDPGLSPQERAEQLKEIQELVMLTLQNSTPLIELAREPVLQ